MTKQRIILGKRGEELAAAYLLGLGMRIRQRNFRGRTGEIDIVAESDDALVFVEVRSRGRKDQCSPFDSVGHKKRKQVRRTVQAYLDAIGYREERIVRIDVVGITFGPDTAQVEHLPNAM